MHDGYIFTLGICGSTMASGPAPASLDLMLAALSPVKRAAYFGEVLITTDLPSLDDPLTTPVLNDIVDADILLITTPLPGGKLPARMHALVRLVEQAAPVRRRRFAAIVAFTDGTTEGLWPLRHALESAAIEILGEIYAPAEADLDELAPDLVSLAHMVYGRAHALHPEALT
ncbi:hypothetical protein EYB53_014680 [Candidatus Chloroploca sp. M-50]|uniref:Uncharacterized protein n=1 Tax=Candidatus Chloroploca mongolica TaxID=2528176 RepID=A0ABS4DBZ7_9CHLR|nr:hypothetical protein [Candidatus Chloroploca mongolica]MBP1466956.1 hypothetical protein [Candidatus Chloroploca mongolica]